MSALKIIIYKLNHKQLKSPTNLTEKPGPEEAEKLNLKYEMEEKCNLK